ncbi:MAG TPA: histidinol dehydrogenase [Spirochaetes bacterium]|nr:histidinol dehydrogenase [Spirochaetota bacterium]
MTIRIEDLSSLLPDRMSDYVKTEKSFFLKSLFSEDMENKVNRIIRDVEKRGDIALIEATKRFDGVSLNAGGIKVSNEQIDAAGRGFDDNFYHAVDLSIKRVRKYHELAAAKDWMYSDDTGSTFGQKYTPLERVGIYIPGGKASYPSTLIMTAVPALVAGVKEIAVVSPPSSFEDHSPLASVIKKLEGITDIYRVGGVQGVAALAFGTQTIKKVDKIVGPGNIYVTLAKKLLYGYVDIDMIAGPSEVLVISDGSEDPELTAADLLAQAEHDEQARALCVTLSPENARDIRARVEKLTEKSVRKDIIKKSIDDSGRIFIVRDLDCAAALANAIAPEHLEIQTGDPGALLDKIQNAGAIFLGRYSPEAIGDYIAGPSHVLPTGGTARFFSPLSTTSFTKFSSVIDVSKNGLDILGRHAARIARAEGLYSHAESITLREELD